MPKTRVIGLLAVLLAGCGGNDAIMPPPGVGPAPAIGVGVLGAASLPRGSTAELTVTVARLAGFTGAITLSAEGLPAGVTAAFAPATVPGSSTTSTLALTASASATVGTVVATVRAKATGVTDATSQVVIGVTP